MLEGDPLFGRKRRDSAMKVPHEIAFAIGHDAIAQNEIVHPSAYVDRIDLHITVVTQRRRDAGQRRIEIQDSPGEKARRAERDE